MCSDEVIEAKMSCGGSANGGRGIALNLCSVLERMLRPLQSAALIEYVDTISGSKRVYYVANGNVYRACNLMTIG